MIVCLPQTWSPALQPQTPKQASAHCPFHWDSISPTTSNDPHIKLRLLINPLKTNHLGFLFVTENCDPIGQNHLKTIQKSKLGKCVSWSNLSTEETSTANLIWLHTYSPFPAPSALLRDRNLNCKQPLTIYFYLTMSSFCLQEHPNHSGLLQEL